MKRPECPTCSAWEKRLEYCGYEVVEGKGRCRHDGKPVGMREVFVSPFQYAEGEERE